MLEDYATDFIETWSTGHAVYGEHGAKSVHKVFNLLQWTYYSMQPVMRKLQSMLKEYCRLVQPGAKALKPVIINRKRHSEAGNSVLS